jgi:hypothetical protein
MFASLVLMTSITTSCAHTNVAMMTVRVVDDLGEPVSGATVRVYFGTSKAEGFSDADGLFIHTGSYSDTGRAVAEKPGYYGAQSDETPFAWRNVMRAIPWNPTNSIVLKRVINPHSMLVSWMPPIPVLGQSVGWDFMAADWVRPHGTGQVADVLMKSSGKIWDRDRPGLYNADGVVELSFTNPCDGVLAYKGIDRGSSRWAASDYRGPQVAPDSGFVSQTQLVYSYYVVSSNGEDALVQRTETWNFLFRIRVETNEQGDIIGGYYGKMEDIQPGWTRDNRWRLVGHYYINPKTLERNVEHGTNRATSNIFLRSTYNESLEAWK